MVFTGAHLAFDRPSYFQMDTDSNTHSPGPGTSSEPARVPDDSSFSERDLVASAKTRPEVSAESPTDIDDIDLDVTASNLPDKLGFTKEFQD